MALVLILISGCRDFTDDEVYKPPTDLEGKLYDQITLAENSDLSTFATCLELTGIAEIINKTGYYTVFAPTNDAFQVYFENHPEYNGQLEKIPLNELEEIVRFHILQDGWTMGQLTSMDFQGWIDPDNPFYNKPKGFKRATVLLDTLKKEWVKIDKYSLQIVEENAADEYRMVFPDSRKYVPLYYQAYMGVFNLTSSDYEYYFNRPFEGENNIYYANGKLLSEDIAAENGFVYKIDRVVEPMENLQQILENNDDYSDFKKLIYNYPEFEMDLDETYNQPGAREGLDIDTLYKLTFPGQTFSINNEVTAKITSSVNYTIREHNSLIAPTNSALQSLYDNIILSSSGYPHYPDKASVPDEISNIVINSHMTNELLYESNLSDGFINGVDDFITIDPSTVRESKYGSNGVFLGIDQAIVPFAFKSVAAPVYLRPGYQTFFYAIENTKILPALTKSDVEYSYYIIEDNDLQSDSSLLLVWDDYDAKRYHFNAYDKAQGRFTRIRQDVLSKWMMNQIVVGKPEGYARKEFLENLGGNYIIINNENNSVQGALSSVYGFEGDSAITLIPEVLEEPSENGISYNVNGWFLNSVSSLYNVLASHKRFIDLLDKAGLAEKLTFRILFLSETEFYTVLVPTDEALDAVGADTMSNENLEKMLRLHFIKGHLIFTDGKIPSGIYETMQVDEERSNEFNTYYTTLNLDTGFDEIEVLDDDGNLMVRIEEAAYISNTMAARDDGGEGDTRYNFVTNSVVHVIDKVLAK